MSVMILLRKAFGLLIILRRSPRPANMSLNALEIIGNELDTYL